ncbi:MAG: hypothetical protein P4M08_09225 [Oligoflexia bacterium]|nr:hypothetical protein [Oligoflexia bacterium]
MSRLAKPSLLAISAFTLASIAFGGETAPAGKALPPVWNGNTCEPDSARLCLGLAGKSRDAWVNCMREHYAQLTANCQAIMTPKNFKEQPAESTNAQAAPGAAAY